MPPKADPRGAQAPRRSGASSANRSEQEAESANTAENAATASPTAAAVPSASSPNRPPVQRLQSLNRRAPGGSIGPRGIGQPAKPTLKFKPRASTRRSKEERDAIQELEAERNRQRYLEAEAINRETRPARPRGTFRGRGGMGALGAAGKRGGRYDSYNSRAPSAPLANMSPYYSPAARDSGAEDYYSSDEDRTALRINIEDINLDDSDEDSDDEDVKTMKDRKGKRAMKSSTRSLSNGLRPVRVERHPHQERVVSVNTEASSAASAEIRRQAQEEEDDEESDNELFVSENQGEFKVKREPTDGDSLMADLPDHDETPLPKQKVKARKRVTVKDPRSLLQTKEELEEFDRHVEDLESLKDILTPDKKPTEGTEGTQNEGEGTKEKEKEEEYFEEKNAGRLFMIQFPPLTPNLVVLGTDVVEIPDEDSVTVTHESAGLDEPEVKREHDDEDEEEGKSRRSTMSKPRGPLVTATQRQMPAGRVGKLNLHKSGRVTLDWGGISFELDKGTSLTFIQEAIVASTPAEDADGKEDDSERSVWAMGQLSEKFVASPEWDKLL